MTHDRFAAVRIRLDRAGRVDSLRLAWNSGDGAFNKAALHAAALSAYLPASRSCRATASEFDYLFVAKAGAADVKTSVIQQMRG
jgi:TonB family protein